MASSGCRAGARLGLLLGAIAAIAACSQRSTETRGAPSITVTDPGIDLAPGEGREIMLAKCLGCHNLGGIDLFAGFYLREDWRELIETMVAHGAAIDAAEAEVIVDYLALHYSPSP